MGAQTVTTAKSAQSPARHAPVGATHVTARSDVFSPQRPPLIETVTSPVGYASIPSLPPVSLPVQLLRPAHAAPLSSMAENAPAEQKETTHDESPLVLLRKCASCAADDDDDLHVQRKASLSIPAIPALLNEDVAAFHPLTLQRKCASCEMEEEELAVQRKCDACVEEEHEELEVHRKGNAATYNEAALSRPSQTQPPIHSRAAPKPIHWVREALQHSYGETLDPAVRKQMEHAYGTDLGQVRIHVGTLAQKASTAVAAQAYTLGQSIYFAPGRYQPHTSAGRELLAHELAHVVQNRIGFAPAPSRKQALSVSSPHDAAELEADAAARAAMEGRRFTVRGHGTASLYRKDTWDKVVDWGSTTIDKAESAAASGIKEVADFTADQALKVIRTVSPGLADIIDEGPINYAKRKVSEALDAHMPEALGGFSISELGKGISSWLGETKDFVKGVAQGDAEACAKFKSMMHAMSTFVGKIIDNPVIDAVTGALGKVSDFVSKVLKVVGEPLFDGLQQYLSGAWSALKKVASTVSGWFNSAKQALGDAWTWLSKLLGFDGSSEDGVWAKIKEEANKVWTTIKAAIEPAIAPLKKVATVIALLTPMGQIHAIIKYGPKVVKVVKWIWENGLNPEKIREAPEEIRGTLESISGNVSGFKEVIKSGLDWIKDKISSLSESVLDTAGKISGLPLISFAHTLFDEARNGLQTVVTDIEQGAEKAETSIETFAEKVDKFVQPYKGVISSIIIAIASPPTIPVLLAGWAWGALPKCIKVPILDFVLDIAIKALGKIPALPTMGPLWALLKPGVMAFLQTLRKADDAVKEKVSNKIAKILSGSDPAFLIAFVKGFAQGVWEGISDPISAIYTVMEGLDKATNYLLSLAGFGDKPEAAVPPAPAQATPAAPSAAVAAPAAAPAAAVATPAPAHANAAPAAASGANQPATYTSAPVNNAISSRAAPSSTPTADPGTHEPAAPLGASDLAALKSAASEAAQSVAPEVATIKGNFWSAVQEYFNGSKITFDEMVTRLSETWESAKQKIAEGGGWLAGELLGFFQGDEAEDKLGDKIGWVSGSLVFQIVLDALTAGTWTEADGIIVGIAKFINWPMEALGEAFKLLKTLGKYLLDGLKSLGSVIKDAAGGAFKAVSKAVGSLGEKLLAFGEEMFGKFGGKAAQAETKAVGAIGKEGVELGQRETAKLAGEDGAKALEQNALADEGKVVKEHEPAAQEGAAKDAKSPDETGHIESDKLTPEQLHGETEMLAEHPDMVKGTPPNRRAEVGEHEWMEEPLPDGECRFCRHSAARVCIKTPELRTAELEKAEQRVESATAHAQERADEAATARLEADTHPDLSTGDRTKYASELDEATKRAEAAKSRLGSAKGQLTNATKKGDAATIEAAEKKLRQIEQEIERAEADAKDLQGILGEHEKVLADADKAEARSAAAEADLKDTQKVATTQQGLSADVDAAEAKVRDIWAKNKQMRPGIGTPEGRELAKAEQDLAQARKELATHIETAQGLTVEIREGLRSGTPFKSAGGAERYRTWLESLPADAKGTGGNYIDYVTGESLPLSSLSPDHVVPVDEIFRMEGFGKLSREDQQAILDLKENLAFLERGRNSTKQAKSIGDWIASDRKVASKVSPAKLAQLEELESNARKSLQDEIAKRLKGK